MILYIIKMSPFLVPIVYIFGEGGPDGDGPKVEYMPWAWWTRATRSVTKVTAVNRAVQDIKPGSHSTASQKLEDASV